MLKDINREKSLIQTIEFIKNSTKIAPKSSSLDVETLNVKMSNRSLIINSEYQRNYIQTVETASAYIESIFLGLIIPEIHIFEDYHTGTREVIDGQQRVMSLLKFYNGKFQLKNLKEFPELNGLKFNELPQELQNVIKNFQVNVRTFSNPDDEYKYIIFERLNTGTKKLNSQEVRNCVYRGPMIDMVRDIAELDVVKKTFLGVNNIRFERVEVILNIMSLLYYFKNTDTKYSLNNDSMKKRINEYLEMAKEYTEEDIKATMDKFLELTEFIFVYIDLKELVNVMYPDRPNFFASVKTVCESLYPALDSFDLSICEENIEPIKTNLYKIFTSPEYKDTIGTTSGRMFKSILSRDFLVRKAIEDAIKQGKVVDSMV